MQDSLFDMGAAPVEKQQAADANRSLEQTCWKDCGHCGMTDHTQYHKNHSMRIYKLCHVRLDVPEPVFINSKCCEHFLDSWRFQKADAQVKPQTSDWADY